MSTFISELKTFQITKYESCSVYSDLTEGELDLFKELLSAMNGMEEVELCQFYVSFHVMISALI